MIAPNTAPPSAMKYVRIPNPNVIAPTTAPSASPVIHKMISNA